jgi:plasmid maintenance system killer protein
MKTLFEKLGFLEVGTRINKVMQTKETKFENLETNKFIILSEKITP